MADLSAKKSNYISQGVLAATQLLEAYHNARKFIVSDTGSVTTASLIDADFLGPDGKSENRHITAAQFSAAVIVIGQLVSQIESGTPARFSRLNDLHR